MGSQHKYNINNKRKIEKTNENDDEQQQQAKNEKIKTEDKKQKILDRKYRDFKF